MSVDQPVLPTAPLPTLPALDSVLLGVSAPGELSSMRPQRHVYQRMSALLNAPQLKSSIPVVQLALQLVPAPVFPVPFSV